MKRIALVGLTLVALVFAPAAANAASITYFLDIDNCTGGCGAAPYGQVTLDDHDLTGAVDVTVDLFNGNKFVDTGFPGAFGFNLSGSPTITVSNLTSGFSLVSGTAGSLQFDGFGMFMYAIACPICGGGSNPQAGPLEFTVNASGLTIDSFAVDSRIPPGEDKAFFVADILSAETGKTGPVGGKTPGEPFPVPEGGVTAILLGVAILGIAGMRRFI